MNRSVLTGCLWLMMSSISPVALAQGAPNANAANATGPSDQLDAPPVTADQTAFALFVEARKLLDQGQIAEACEHFARCDAITSTIASLLNLGLCHRELGELVLAHDYYRRAQAAALAAQDNVRANAAGSEAADIESQIGRLTLLVIDRSDNALEVSVDGEVQAKDRWGSPIFVPAGVHAVVARSPNAETWRDSVTLAASEHRLITIPQLISDLPNHAVPAQLRVEPGLSVQANPAADTGMGTQHWGAVSLAAAGAIGAGLAVTFGILALDANASSSEYCSDRNVCQDRGLELRQRANAHASRADIAGALSILALGSAAILWFTAPTQEAHAQVGLHYQPDAVRLLMRVRL